MSLNISVIDIVGLCLLLQVVTAIVPNCDDPATADANEYLEATKSSGRPVNLFYAPKGEFCEPEQPNESIEAKFYEPSDPDQIEAKRNQEMAANMIALEFEVFGKVQGVFFRKYTVNKGKELGLRGWCQNTLQGTVVGEVEGSPSKVNQMKEWLAKVGSPKSQITRAEFRNERRIEKHYYDSFDVRK